MDVAGAAVGVVEEGWCWEVVKSVEGNLVWCWCGMVETMDGKVGAEEWWIRMQ